MGKETKISWTEATWNPFHGCKKISEGCKFCYMYRDKERYKQDPTTVIRSKGNFYAPLKWKEPKVIFTCSWSDWFIEEADVWRDELWDIIKKTPHHTYQILTKRPYRIKDHLPSDWGKGYPNVWLGVSVENNKNVERIKILQDVPAKIKFVSMEPLLERIDLIDDNGEFILKGVNWVIIGGESGNKTGKYRYRLCELSWIKIMVDTIRLNQSNANPIAIFVKQLGTHLASEMDLSDRHGGDIDEFPKEIKFREFPSKRNSYAI